MITKPAGFLKSLFPFPLPSPKKEACCQSERLLKCSAITHAVQLYKICACLACYGHTTHNNHVLAMPDKFIFLQALLNYGYQVFDRSFHFNTVGPHAPPQCELMIYMFGGGIGQDGHARAIF